MFFSKRKAEAEPQKKLKFKNKMININLAQEWCDCTIPDYQYTGLFLICILQERIGQARFQPFDPQQALLLQRLRSAI